MKYLVTGGSGFIGSSLVKQLEADGHSVQTIDKRSGGDVLDLRPEDLDGVDGIFHLAAVVGIPQCLEDPCRAGMVNAQGALRVLECARLAKVKRVVLASSNVFYAHHTPYQASKEMLELWVRCYVETFQLSALALRFSNVYGPGQTFGVIPAFRKSIRKNGYVTVSGDGEQSRDFTHVSDIVRGLIQAMGSEYVGEAIDLCTGKNWTVNQIRQLLGNPVVRWVESGYSDTKHIRQSPLRAREILFWQADIQLNDGIKESLTECQMI